MKKINKIILSFLGGIDATIYIFTPIILATLWITIAEIGNLYSILFYILGSLATFFRAIKIGWMNNE